MAQHIEVMIAAVIIAIAVMYVASEPVAGFILRHPTTKMLALSFLILIGVALIADGFDVHIPRGYVYFAMAFAAVVEAFQHTGAAAPQATAAIRRPTPLAQWRPLPMIARPRRVRTRSEQE